MEVITDTMLPCIRGEQRKILNILEDIILVERQYAVQTNSLTVSLTLSPTYAHTITHTHSDSSYIYISRSHR